MINGRTRLHVVANGTMTGQRYIDEVLLPHDCLDSEGIQRLVWPARSQDLNPIENVWDVLGRQVAGRNYPPTNKNTLIRALTEEWDKLPQQLLDNVVQSMCPGKVLKLHFSWHPVEQLKYSLEFGMSRDMQRHEHRNFISIGNIGDERLCRTPAKILQRISGMTSNLVSEKALFQIRLGESCEF
ncbi:transposable element Tcb2 transposase [Trichonephila clavipes]|nr:transposable element Tcb2 transposase [Trichonephila clavipes]